MLKQIWKNWPYFHIFWVVCLPKRRVDVSTKLPFVDCDINEMEISDEGVKNLGPNCLHSQPSSFITLLPNGWKEVDQIRSFIGNKKSTSSNLLDWPEFGSCPINEYNIEGLLYMEFPILFPISDVDWLHWGIFNVEMHEYGLHILKHFDNRFGSHPWFWYFLLNMIVHHHIQGTSFLLSEKEYQWKFSYNYWRDASTTYWFT